MSQSPHEKLIAPEDPEKKTAAAAESVSRLAPGPTASADTSTPDMVFSAPFIRILLVQLAFGFSYSAFLLLPKFLRVQLHASATEIGWVSGAALVAAAVLSPFIGVLATRTERRNLIAFALVLAGTSGLVFTTTTAVGPLVYLLRAMQGLAWVLVFNCTATMTADLVPKHRLSQAIGFLGVSMLATNALAPAVAEPVAARFGWGYAFGVPAVLSLLSVALIPGLPRDARELEASPHPAPLGRRLLPVFYASFLMGAGIGVMFTFTQPYALSLGAERVGDFFFGYVGAAMFVRVGLSSLADRVGPPKVATFALIPYALVLVLTAYLTPGTLLLLGAGLGASHGFMYPALMATGMAHLNAKQRSVFMGWLTFNFNVGFASSVLGLGAVADSFGYQAIFWLTGLLIASGVAPLGLSQGVLGQRRLAKVA